MNSNQILGKLKNTIIGKGRDPHDPSMFHNLSLIAFFAWVGLGSDGVSSSCYGPPEIMQALHGHYHLSIIVALASVITIIVISSSYSQIIELFPSGGGGYLVASKLLSPSLGMVSGCALLIDYVLTITVSVASGVDALFSFLPKELYFFRIYFALFFILLLTLLNLRGVKESVLPLVPVFIIFILTHLFAILYSVFFHIGDMPSIVNGTGADIQNSFSTMGVFGTLFIIMHAYSMGAGTYTGIEAVSNGLPILREPRALTAKRTMKYMAVSLSVIVLGLIISYLLFNVQHQPGLTLNAVLFNTMTAAWNSSTGKIFVVVTLVSEAAILLVAAQTGFLDGPRVLSNMALDRWVPTRFASLSDRLVTQNGILLMGIAAFVLMLVTNGSIAFLVVLYSINVFITFSLSQLGMVRHWWQVRKTEKKWGKKLIINGIGLSLTLFILIMVIVVKFNEGGWITIAITGSLVLIVLGVKRHYNNVWKMMKRLDSIVIAIEESDKVLVPKPMPEIKFDKNARTAVLMVNGYSGLGLHSLFNIFRVFGDTFQNYVFLQIGIIDAGVFKGVQEIEELENKMRTDIEKYKNILTKRGYYAETISTTGLDVLESLDRLLPEINQKFPHSIFFGGQIVFKEEKFFSRWLHNHTVFSVQRKLYHDGIQFIILPIRVDN